MIFRRKRADFEIFWVDFRETIVSIVEASVSSGGILGGVKISLESHDRNQIGYHAKQIQGWTWDYVQDMKPLLLLSLYTFPSDIRTMKIPFVHGI
jgi:hypothetical protein